MNENDIELVKGNGNVFRDFDDPLADLKPKALPFCSGFGDRVRIPSNDVPWIVRQLPWVELENRGQGPAGVERIADAIRSHP